MSLESKSTENLTAAERYYTEGKYHIVAGRAYYAAYQLLKKYLISLCPGIENKEYPHGIIGAEAQKKFYMNIRDRRPEIHRDIQRLAQSSNIYAIRKRADYEDAEINPDEAMKCLSYARHVSYMVTKYHTKRG